ncbi:unnamed protein product [Durusdinium trenchii]|uniref:Pentatricopeptide repeat-containing protein, chloroplastic n=1 Tax=Durusdinium trenchii TaxID=1381693 RepID=A0ABP0PH08_9DINO
MALVRGWPKVLHCLLHHAGRSARLRTLEVNATLAALSASQQWPMVLHLWSLGQSFQGWRDVVSYNILCHALGRGTQWIAAQRCFQQLQAHEDLQPNIRSFNTMLSVYEKSTAWKQACVLLARMLKEELQPDQVSHHTMISAFSKGHQPLKALQALDVLRDRRRPGLAGYNAALRSLALEDEAWHLWPKAFDLCRKMREDGLEADLGTYNAWHRQLMSIFGFAGKWNWALHLLREVNEARLCPDNISWSSIVNACSHGSHWQVATSCLATMRRVKGQPNVVVYSALIKAYERASQWERAVRILSLMLDGSQPRPNRVTWGAVISSASQGHAWQHALLLLSMARRHELQLITSINIAISACAASKHWRQSLALLDECLAPDLVTFNAFLAACESAQKWESALQTIQTMQQRHFQPDLISFNTWLSTYQKASEWERALDVFKEMSHRGALPDDISYNVVISACHQAAQWQVATGLLCAAASGFDPLSCASGLLVSEEVLERRSSEEALQKAMMLLSGWVAGQMVRGQEPFVLINALAGLLRARSCWPSSADLAFLRRVSAPMVASLMTLCAGGNTMPSPSLAGLATGFFADVLERLKYGTERCDSVVSLHQIVILEAQLASEIWVIPLEQEPSAYALTTWLSFDLELAHSSGPRLALSGELVRPKVATTSGAEKDGFKALGLQIL